jgi:hypothetical protein
MLRDALRKIQEHDAQAADPQFGRGQPALQPPAPTQRLLLLCCLMLHQRHQTPVSPLATLLGIARIEKAAQRFPRCFLRTVLIEPLAAALRNHASGRGLPLRLTNVWQRTPIHQGDRFAASC